jgi:hypothetical protein
LSPLRAQDAKFAADSLKYSCDFYSKVHFVAIAKLDFGSGGAADFKYDRYPNSGPERIQSGDGEFARKDGKTWLRSNDWGETGKPVDAQTSKRLNNWVGLIDARLNGEPASNDSSEGATLMKFLGKEDQGDREELVFEESREKPKAKSYSHVSFGRFKNAKEYSKGFKWLAKDSQLQWLKKEIVTADGRKWADWRFVPMLKGKRSYSHNPVYTRFLTTSYKGQLLEITFTSNLNTNPELKKEIDHIMDSVHLEE